MAALPQLSIPSIAISGSELPFQVRRIYCVGRNYADHAREMGGDPQREFPFFFSKPADAVVPSGWRLPFPVKTSELPHQVEFGIGLNKGGANIHAQDDSSVMLGDSVSI